MKMSPKSGPRYHLISDLSRRRVGRVLERSFFTAYDPVVYDRIAGPRYHIIC